MTSDKFAGGRNIAIKTPPHQYDATVRFYRDVVGLKPLTNHLPKHVFQFGASQLWIDRVDGMSQAEVWLELVVDDVAAASKHLGMCEIIQRNEIEPLPEGFDGFWISNPASIIHLVSKRAQS